MRRAMFILSAMAMVAAASCTKEIVDVNKETALDVELFPMTFTASSQQTKAEMVDAKTIHWQSGDQINVFDGTATVYEPFTTSGEGASVTFEGMAGKAEGYYALYPYQSSATMTDGVIKATFPSEQTAVEGSFDPKAFISVAQSDAEGNFSFKNVAALVKFTMPVGENATSATLTANADKELLCGPVNITFDENGNPSAPSAGKMTNAVTLKGNLEGGKTYYFVVRPGIAFSEGLTISIDGKKYRTSSTKLGKTLVRNSVMALPDFTFKEGMPKDLYTAYEHGFDLQIGGQKFDKATYGEATLITKAISAPKAGIYFLNPEIEQPMGSGISHMAIIGRYADRKSILKRDEVCYYIGTSEEDYMILANVEYLHTPTQNYVFGQAGDGHDYELVVFDNIKTSVLSANNKNQQYLLYFGSENNNTFTGTCVVANSDICYATTANGTMISIASVGKAKLINIKNNVIYYDGDENHNCMKFRVLSTTSAAINSLYFDENTVVNMLSNAQYLTVKQEENPIKSVRNNLFYLTTWDKAAYTSQQYIARNNSIQAAAGDPVATEYFSDNFAYYGAKTNAKELRALYSCATNKPSHLTTAPFTSDQIAAGNFALPEGTTYGAKR